VVINYSFFALDMENYQTYLIVWMADEAYPEFTLNYGILMLLFGFSSPCILWCLVQNQLEVVGLTQRRMVVQYGL
jgi:hypothetical protein